VTAKQGDVVDSTLAEPRETALLNLTPVSTCFVSAAPSLVAGNALTKRAATIASIFTVSGSSLTTVASDYTSVTVTTAAGSGTYQCPVARIITTTTSLGCSVPAGTFTDAQTGVVNIAATLFGKGMSATQSDSTSYITPSIFAGSGLLQATTASAAGCIVDGQSLSATATDYSEIFITTAGGGLYQCPVSGLAAITTSTIGCAVPAYTFTDCEIGLASVSFTLYGLNISATPTDHSIVPVGNCAPVASAPRTAPATSSTPKSAPTGAAPVTAAPKSSPAAAAPVAAAPKSSPVAAAPKSSPAAAAPVAAAPKSSPVAAAPKSSPIAAAPVAASPIAAAPTDSAGSVPTGAAPVGSAPVASAPGQVDSVPVSSGSSPTGVGSNPTSVGSAPSSAPKSAGSTAPRVAGVPKMSGSAGALNFSLLGSILFVTIAIVLTY
jgi:hypothetical protein